MAKLAIKSDNITPFGGIYSIFNLFYTSGLRKTIGKSWLYPQPYWTRFYKSRGIILQVKNIRYICVELAMLTNSAAIPAVKMIIYEGNNTTLKI